MKVKHQMVHKFTGEPNKNGDVYAPDCKVQGLDQTIVVTHNFNEDVQVGTANNITLEKGVLFADIAFTDTNKILKNSYVTPAFEIIDPPYDPKEDFEEQLKKPIKEVKIFSLGCTIKPTIKDLDKLPKEVYAPKPLE